MKFFYSFAAILFIFLKLEAAQRAADPFSTKMLPRNTGMPSYNQRDMEMDGDDETLDNMDMEEGMMPPAPPREYMAPVAQQPQNARGPRAGFQQTQDMRMPARLPAPSMQEGQDPYEDDMSDLPPDEMPPPLQSPQAATQADPGLQLPPRNYPPKMPELKFGQTEWNQMDLHSLVDGRRG